MSSGTSPARGARKEKVEEKPRIFDTKAKAMCWSNAETVPGRHPERWRKDAAGNIVCKRFCNCQGCLCFEYDHIIPFSKECRDELQASNMYEKLKIEKVCLLKNPTCDSLVFNSLVRCLEILLGMRGESVAENCQILQTRVNRLKADKQEIDGSQLKAYSCDIKFSDKELDIIEMAVYGDVIRPGNQCRCRTVAEMLGQFKSKDRMAPCKLPHTEGSL